jgi:saccharopine dehydrogenase (NAD+, L-lysine-forming)
MKKVLIVGAGGQGGPCASILARDKSVTDVVLGDIDIELANRVKNKIKSDKITTVKLDAGKVEEIKSAARGVDVIINLTLVEFNDNIRQAAVESGAHYVDAAGDYQLLEQLTRGELPEIDKEFKKAGLTALIGCGGTPGVSNVLVKYACDKLDRIESICIRCSGKILQKPQDIISAWDPGWSPKIAITDYAEETIVFENGEYKRHPPFSGREEYDFAPFGKVLLSHHAHEEVSMLPHFIGKGVKYCDFKYPVDVRAGNLVKLGFASDKPIDVKGVKVSPLDVLVKLVPSPVNAFFTEDEAVKHPVDFAKIIVIKVKGVKSGEDVEHIISYHYNLFATTEDILEIYKKFGTINIYVALPAIVGAKMCVGGFADKGVIGPECLDPIKFLKSMADMGWPVKFQETISKDVYVS